MKFVVGVEGKGGRGSKGGKRYAWQGLRKSFA